MKKEKIDWWATIFCSEMIAIGIIVITLLGYYFWNLFI